MGEQKDQLQKVYQKLEDGGISIAEALKQSNALTAEITTKEAINLADQRTREVLMNKDIEAARAKFHEDHPDYSEIVASGKLQSYIDKNPMFLDETIAYFQYKADQEFKRGEEEVKETSKKKEKTANKPLTEPELEAVQMETVIKMKESRPTRQAPLSESEIEKQQLETIKRMRGE